MLVKRVGQPASFMAGPTNEITATFVVDKIAVDGKCTSQFATKPENGHFVMLGLESGGRLLLRGGPGEGCRVPGPLTVAAWSRSAP